MEKRGLELSRVRVLIPTYNRANLVSSAIASALSQTHRDLEVIVVDDGSTDETRSVVESIATQDARVIYRFKENGGVSSARNAGILCAGCFSYVAFLDADDEWIAQDHLAKAVATFREAQEVDILFARTEINDQIDRWTPEEVHVREDRYSWPKQHAVRRTSLGAIVIDQGDAFFGLLTGDLAPHTSTVIVRAERLGIGAWFDEDLEVFEDIHLYTRLARQYVFAFFDDVHARMSYYGDNLTTQLQLDSTAALRKLRSISLHAHRLYELCVNKAEKEIVSRAISDYSYLIGQALADQGEYKEASRVYSRSLRWGLSFRLCRSLVKSTLLGFFEK